MRDLWFRGSRMSDLLTAGDAALILGVSPATVRLWALAGKLAAQQTQRGVRIFDRREVERGLPTVDDDFAVAAVNRGNHAIHADSAGERRSKRHIWFAVLEQRRAGDDLTRPGL